MFNRKEKAMMKTPDQTRKTIKKNIEINGQTCIFIIEDVLFETMDQREVMLDEELINSMVKEMATALKRNYSKYNTLPTQVIVSKEERERQEKKMIVEETNFLECFEPRYRLNEVFIPPETEKQLQAVLSISKHHQTLFGEWGFTDTVKKGKGIVLNFFGPPGTGKSMLAEAIAHELGKKVFVVNYADLESKYVGETPKNIRKAFQRAMEEDAVLVFDESDSFLGKRLTNVNQSSDYGVNVTRSVMLMEIEKFEGMVIFTTNLLSNYDEAFRRRILANLEFTYPDEAGRERIWKIHLPNKLPVEVGITSSLLAQKYETISGADIKDIAFYAAVLTLQNGKKRVSWDEFDQAVEFVKKRYIDKDFKIKTETITQAQYEKELAEVRSGV